MVQVKIVNIHAILQRRGGFMVGAGDYSGRFKSRKEVGAARQTTLGFRVYGLVLMVSRDPVREGLV